LHRIPPTSKYIAERYYAYPVTTAHIAMDRQSQSLGRAAAARPRCG
jgi:hypothetical protein